MGMGMRMRGVIGMVLATLVVLVLAACGGAPTVQTSSAPTATATAAIATSVPTTIATATATVTAASGNFACPETTSGATTTFSDTQTGLSFSFPSSWTEHNCQRLSAQALLVGNLFIVSLQPRNGQTIQQMVDATEISGETVTLMPLADPHVAAADTVSVTFANGQGSPTAPFLQTVAIIQGSQRFYSVTWLTAQMSMTDTMMTSPDELRQVVATFQVP